MVTVHLTKFHKFFEDYDNRLEKEYGVRNPKLEHSEHLRHLRDWYSFDVQIDELGTEALVEMSEENYTLFAIKYS